MLQELLCWHKAAAECHSNVCKQLVPLISTAMLSKHKFLSAVTTTSHGQTSLNPIHSPFGKSHSCEVSPTFAIGSQLFHCLPVWATGRLPFSGALGTHKSSNHALSSLLIDVALVATSKSFMNMPSPVPCELTVCLTYSISTLWSLLGCFPCPASGKLIATTQVLCWFAY